MTGPPAGGDFCDFDDEDLAIADAILDREGRERGAEADRPAATRPTPQPDRPRPSTPTGLPRRAPPET